MKKTIAAVTLARDSAKYIVPHLRMYTGVDKNIALFIDQPIIGGSDGHGAPDNTEALIQEYCPEVEIHHTGENIWGADIFNKMIELGKGYDKVVMFHADVVMNQENWIKLREFILNTDFDVYKLDMTKCTINYYHDFEHGVRDCEDIEPIAVDSSMLFTGIYSYPTEKKTTVIEWITVHHFTGWKGRFATKQWLNNEIASVSGVKISDMTKDWISCPNDIRKEFI